MDIRNLDLNLLATLDALLAERNVTHAARRLNLSQPALSARLARLRAIFGDPLLIPGRRGMVPTARALELTEPLRAALHLLHDVVSAAAPFDPATAHATITIVASDYVQYALMMPLLCRLRDEARGLRVAWKTANIPEMPTQLEQGEADFWATIPEDIPQGLRTVRLYDEDYVSIARLGHPHVRGAVDLDLFARLDHIMVSPEGGGFSGPTDMALAARGLQRRVVLSAPGFLMVPEIVARSDMIALVPARVVRSRGLPLQILPPPLHVPGFEIVLAWHDRTTLHPMYRWVREKIVSMAGQG